MAAGKVIGQIQVSEGNIKIVGVDGVVREPKYSGYVFENEQVVSSDPNALFQIKFLALPEASAYDGIFRVLADGSVVYGRDAMESVASDESLVNALKTSASDAKDLKTAVGDADDLETAAGEEGAEGSSSFTETEIVASSSVLGFNRGPNTPLGFGVVEFSSVPNYDALQQALPEDATPPNITPPVITSSDVALFNETDTSSVMQVTASSDNGVSFSISGGDSENFTIDPLSGILKFNEVPDYENPLDTDKDNHYEVYVTATDDAGNYTTQLLTISINNITGNVATAPAESLVLHTFDSPPGNNNEGWIGEGNESAIGTGNPENPPEELGWFYQDSDTRWHTFALGDNAEEDVNISFKLGVKEWENDDTFVVRVYDSENEVIHTETYSPDSEGVGYFNYDFDVTVPEDGIIKVEFQSVNTDSQGQDREAWSIDDFGITGADGEQVITFDSAEPSDGAINIGVLLEQGNDFEGDEPDSVDEINLADGDYTLSNITLADVIDITDGDKVLKITGNSSDGVSGFAENGWVLDTSPDVTEAGYNTYTNIDDSSVQLLIDVDIPIETV
ncbi:MAG: cadherin repeat domain-containing protein [Sulfurimonas sp.]|uniref:cadherin repeat domain-containing protein n=1 Tax=Sulfurimonas sp. TaxID=2022749 RepID=UPI00262ECD1F|nr:cadherin repeat domain-containing protein [Sulfurimonas sp.]MDD2653292.1 cadherin repeat domain-containing protein [Sulfurimonas sp.]MDD3451241.1 cadherin repeat domain-containing protein [Sulfurimonas sp.]